MPTIPRSGNRRISKAVIKVSRRQEYASQTRQAIVDAARFLFAKQGYAGTTVEDIAERARVAGITVYTTVGGKSGLLRILMEVWSNAPIVEQTLADIRDLKQGKDVILAVANVSRAMREEFGDIMYVMLNAAPHDTEVASSLKVATARYRRSFKVVAAHLESLRAIQSGVDVVTAAEVLWFYFGYSSYYTLHNEIGWSYDRAQKWLAEAAIKALLP